MEGKILTFKKKGLRSIFQTTMGKICIILIIPAIILLAFASTITAYYINNYKNLLASSYTNELNSFLIDTEEQMNSIISTTVFISQTGDINALLTSPDAPVSVSDISFVLDNAKKSSQLIDSIILYNKSADYIITSTGMYSPNEYFESLYAYDKYPLDYWYKFSATAKSTKILPASSVTNSIDNATQTIVPIVFTPFDTSANKNLLIFNISIDQLFNYFEECNLTPNSEFYMIDNSSDEVYSNSVNILSSNEHQEAIRTLKNSLRVNSEMISVGGEKYLSIKSTARSNIWGYTYHVLVPNSDINSNAATIILVSFMSILVLVFLMVLFVLFGTKSLYTPWKKLAHFMNSHKNAENTFDKLPSDIANYIAAEISDIATANETLKQNLAVTLPLSQEKYLIDILNNSNNNPELDSEILAPLSFKYDYFMSIAVNITINPQYFANNPAIDATHLNKEIYKIVKMFFSNSFITYELPSMSNILYFLLNLESDTLFEEIQAVVDKITDMFTADRENITIYFGIGNIYQGFDGLKLTHQEAISNVLNEMNSDKIHIFSPQNSNFPFNSSKESVLINYLIAGHTEKALELLNNVFTQTATVSYEVKKQVYSDIIFAFERVLRQKHIRPEESPSDVIKNLSNDTEIHTYIKSLLDIISKDMQTPTTKLDISAVVEYISDHYTEEIYLETIADAFNTSMKYLSRRIRQHLNMPFKDYLTKLRIDKAKELLETTDIKISDLYTAVGFQNRAAFLRAFKMRVGLTPSDYRKNLQSKQ